MDGFSLLCGDISVEHHVNNVGASVWESDHCHEKYEILFITEGSGKYIIEGAEYAISKGMAIMIRPFAYHRVVLDSAVDQEWYSVLFSKSAVICGQSKIFDKLVAEENSGIYCHPSAISSSLLSVLDRFEGAMLLPEQEREAMISLLLGELIVLLSAAASEKIVLTEDELGARVVKYLNRNIEKSISLDRLARHFFVSKYYLCRAFKNYSGISVHSYINYKRIMYAKQLIESGMAASHAADKVGFGDYSAFYRAYVKIVGKSPTAN